MSFINHPVVIGAFVVMIIFAIYDLISFFSNKHKDFKSLIVSTGVAGTFIGVFIGLQEFDTNNIEGSVPTLLEGLKIAFVTSIGGMIISIFINAVEKSLGNVSDDELNVLVDMDKKLSSLPKLEEHSKNTVDQLKNFRVEIKDENDKTRTMIVKSLVKTNESLDKAIETLSKGATEEIIKALENVIQDFNKNLTEQFGENFKKLNESVLKLILWQNNYKEQVEKNTVLLNSISTSLDNSKTTLESISSRNKEVIKVNQALKEALTKQEEQLARSNDNISAQDQIIKNLSSSFKTLSETLENVSNKTDSLSKGIEGSLSVQSDALTKLTDSIRKQLPESLGELETTLAGMTTKFARDYNAFLEQYNGLIGRKQ